jgi:hypothetical protein
VLCSIDIPRSYEFNTWNVGLQGVREAFERVIQQGYQPQVLPAYTRLNKLIHPNNAIATLSGAIVLVHCTLEWMQCSKSNRCKTEYQFYANLLKVQVLKSASLFKSLVPAKRKFIHTYEPNNDSVSAGRSADGSSPSKRCRLAAFTN